MQRFQRNLFTIFWERIPQTNILGTELQFSSQDHTFSPHCESGLIRHSPMRIAICIEKLNVSRKSSLGR